jgi:flagellar hook-associated protein 2
LEKNPDDVQQFFFSSDSENQPGIGDLLTSYVKSYTDSGTGIIDSRKKVLESQVKDAKYQIENFEKRLEIRESTLRKQFLAMEKALSTMNNQSVWLSGQIAGLTASLNTQQ